MLLRSTGSHSLPVLAYNFALIPTSQTTAPSTAFRPAQTQQATCIAIISPELASFIALLPTSPIFLTTNASWSALEHTLPKIPLGLAKRHAYLHILQMTPPTSVC
jgi:hypothetical protein